MRASRPGCGPRHVGDGRTPHMASKDDKLFSTGMASDLPDETAPPVKKAAAKRAPRKATKKASTPAHAPVLAPAEVAPVVSADVTADVTPDADEGKAPARKAAKRAPRKSTKKAAAALVDASVSVDATPAQVEVVPTVKAKKAPEIPGFGLLFQAPEPTAAPRRRRATAPAAAPAPESTSTDQASAEVTTKKDAGSRQDKADQAEDLDELGADGGRRRRRRGGKGRRGRAGDEGGADQAATDTDESAAEGDAEEKSSGKASSDEDESGEGGASRRRTRRRRRGAAGEDEDQAGTTTRLPEPRAPRSEVTSVKGSTRLEAKKQRRREGREAGRRRTIITEAEFLARRESVERVMVVRHKQDRTQIGVLEDGVLVEHYVSRETNASMAGNVYLGRIQNV